MFSYSIKSSLTLLTYNKFPPMEDPSTYNSVRKVAQIELLHCTLALQFQWLVAIGFSI